MKVKLTVQAAEDMRANIYDRIKQTDWILLEFFQESQTLESIFQDLTKEH